MSNPRQYRMRVDRVLNGEVMAKAGDIVFRPGLCDYGLASDDTRLTGIDHICVSHVNDYPLFTVPVRDVEEVNA